MLWSIGRFDLRLSEDEFWHLVPRQFHALMKRLRENRLRSEYGPALIAAVLARAHGSKKVKTTDFMPSWQNRTRHEVPWQEQMDKIKAIHYALGGR